MTLARGTSGLDLDAELIPGRSAAGLRLGSKLSDCGHLFGPADDVSLRAGFNLVAAIERNDGFLLVRDYFPEGSGHTAVFFRADVISFVFNARGQLFEVRVRGGYRGLAFGAIGVGSTIGDLTRHFPVFFDSGDELYYPDREQCPTAPAGIAFHAAAEGGGEDTRICGITVHDWGMMRG